MSSDINVQSFSGKVNITSNLLVGSSHLFVDTTNNRVGITMADPDAGLHVNSNAYVNTDFRVGSDIVMNEVAGRITADSFVGNGSGLTSISSDSGSWVNGTNSNVHLAVSTNNVGIGIDNPSHKLDVDGDINIASGSTLKVGGTPAVFSNWSVDGSDIYRSSGNVGIGATSPDYPLDVQFTGDSGIRAKNTGTSTGDHVSVYIDSGSGYGYLKFQDSGTDKFWIQSTPTGDLAFRPNGSSHVFDIRNSGRIGIGESDPDSILHVQSDVQSGTGGPIKKTAATASTSQYNYILNGPRPGTTTSGAVHFINGSGRSTDGGTNKYTIRNDIGSVDIGRRSVTLIDNHSSAPESFNSEQMNVDIMLNNGSIWMSPYTGRHRDMGNSGQPWSQYVGKYYVGRILAGMEIENRNDRSNGVSGVYYSNLLHLRAHDHGLYEGRTMTIRGNKVGILTETPTYTLYVNGSLYYSSGGLSGSDDRIKYNEENITNALDIIDKLTPQKYEKIMTFPSNAKGTWIPTDENWENVKNAETLPWEGFTHGDEFGFIAQDVRNIPEVSFLVSGSEMETKDESVSLEEYTNLNEEEQGAYTRKYMYEENVITVEEYTDLIPENRDKCTPIYIKQVETQTPLALNYQGIFVIAVKAIQELKADLSETKADLQTTKDDLQTTCNDLQAEKEKTKTLESRLAFLETAVASLIS